MSILKDKESYFGVGSASLRGTGKAVAVGAATYMLGAPAAEAAGVSTEMGHALVAGGSAFVVENIEAAGHRWFGEAPTAVAVSAQPAPQLTAKQVKQQLKMETAEAEAKLAYLQVLAKEMPAGSEEEPSGAIGALTKQIKELNALKKALAES